MKTLFGRVPPLHCLRLPCFRDILYQVESWLLLSMIEYRLGQEEYAEGSYLLRMSLEVEFGEAGLSTALSRLFLA